MILAPAQEEQLVGHLVGSSDDATILKATRWLALGFTPDDARKFETQDFARRVVARAHQEGRLDDFLAVVLAHRLARHDLRKFAERLLTGRQALLPALLPILKRHAVALGPHAAASLDDLRLDGWDEPVSDVGGEAMLAINVAFNLAKRSDDALLRYVGRLADRVAPRDGKAATALGAWLDRVDPQRTARAVAPAAKAEGQPSLMIKVTEATQAGAVVRGKVGGHYLVRAWYCRDAERCEPIGPVIEADEAGLAGCVEVYRKAVRAKLGVEPRGLLLEVFLPRPLLDGSVDTWGVTPGGGLSFPVAAGVEHPVVVRSADRARPGYDRSRMRARWAAAGARPLACLKLNPLDAPPPDACPAVVVDDLGLDPENFYYVLTSGWVDSTGCGLLGRPPRPYPRHRGKAAAAGAWSDIIDLLMAVGFPVILWDRDAKAAADEIQGAVRGRSLVELPRVVFEARKTARAARALEAAAAATPRRRKAARDPGVPPADRWRLGSSLSLLFDDPDRVPPDAE